MTPEPTATWKARHFAAANADARDARVRLEAGALVLDEGAAARHVPLDRVLIVNPGGPRGPVHLEIAGERVEALIVEGEGFRRALQAAAGRGGVKRLGAHRGAVRFVVAVGVIGTLWVIATWICGLPALAGWVAQQVPAGWERQFGEASLEQLAPPRDRVTDLRVVAPAAQVLATLTSLDPAPRDSFRLVVLRADMVNAFALPGGTIVVTTGLLRRFDRPDELAAVLAHEMTHVTERHATRQAIAKLGVRALIGILIGNEGLTGLVGGAAGTLGELQYSRDDETRADDGALRLLARAGIDPRAADRALAAIDSDAPPGSGPDLSFLSTHPGTAARRARIRKLAADVAITPRATLPAPEAWRVMEAAIAADSARSRARD